MHRYHALRVWGLGFKKTTASSYSKLAFAGGTRTTGYVRISPCSFHQGASPGAAWALSAGMVEIYAVKTGTVAW